MKTIAIYTEVCWFRSGQWRKGYIVGNSRKYCKIKTSDDYYATVPPHKIYPLTEIMRYLYG